MSLPCEVGGAISTPFVGGGLGAPAIGVAPRAISRCHIASEISPVFHIKAIVTASAATALTMRGAHISAATVDLFQQSERRTR